MLFSHSTLTAMPLARAALSLWNTRWSVPPANYEIFTQRLRQLSTVLDEVMAMPQIRGRIDLMADLCAKFGDPPAPSTWVLSTGRCGTRALHYFLERAQEVKSYHRGQTLIIGFTERNEMLYRLLLGALDPGFVRAAASRFFAYNLNDMTYCLRSRKQYCITIHGHTIFAPLAARLFPDSQFIYLRRNPIDVLRSYVSKDQYRNQLEPRYVDSWFLDSDRKYVPYRNNFRSFPAAWPLYKKVIWYIHVTNSFARAFTDNIGPARAATIESERLFAGDADVYRLLRERLALSDVSLEQYREHFAAPVNAKSHRDRASTRAWARIDDSVPSLLERLAQTGTY